MNLAKNKKAYFQYNIIEKYEAGIVLIGTEVKSCRANQIIMENSFAIVENNEIFLHNLNISTYDKANLLNHSPTRQRKLLLHKKQIIKIKKAIEVNGFSLIPLSFYLKSGKIKVKIAICRGKNLTDKRHIIRKRQDEITIARATKNFSIKQK